MLLQLHAPLLKPARGNDAAALHPHQLEPKTAYICAYIYTRIYIYMCVCVSIYVTGCEAQQLT